MRIQLTKIVLAASTMLALTFTLSSCSDDKDSGGWVSCSELEKINNECESKYKTELTACKDTSCEDLVEDKVNQCVSDGACNGTNEGKCTEHYISTGCLE